MQSNTKTAIIRDEIQRLQHQDFSSVSESQRAPVTESLEGLGKDQNILISLQNSLAEISSLESKLNFMVKEVRLSLKNR